MSQREILTPLGPGSTGLCEADSPGHITGAIPPWNGGSRRARPFQTSRATGMPVIEDLPAIRQQLSDHWQTMALDLVKRGFSPQAVFETLTTIGLVGEVQLSVEAGPIVTLGGTGQAQLAH